MSPTTGKAQLTPKGSLNTMVKQHLVLFDLFGEVVEWFMALVLKTNRD